jgi:hypothetical protein
MRWLWVSAVLCFLSLYARADAVVTLDFSDFKVESVPQSQFQPVGFGDYFLGGTVPDAFGTPITGPNYGLYSSHSTDPFAGADVFGNHTIQGYGAPTIAMYSTTGFTALTFNWQTNSNYVVPGQSDHPTIFFFDANNNPIAVNESYTNTDLLSGFASISSSATAYSVYFGYPEGTEGRTRAFSDISFDLVSLPNAPSNAPEPASYGLLGVGIIGFGALLRKKRMAR